MPVVVDCSVFGAWCLGDEENAMAVAVMRHVASNGCIVPGIWWYEFRNMLLMNERKGRILRSQVDDTLADCGKLSIETDHAHDDSNLVNLARRFRLAVYDAAYLEIAVRRGVPLATLDKALGNAVQESGVVLYG